MEIKEIKKSKAELQDKIQTLIMNFETETDCYVNKLELIRRNIQTNAGTKNMVEVKMSIAIQGE